MLCRNKSNIIAIRIRLKKPRRIIETKLMKIPDDRKRHAMDAITNAQTVAHIGLVKATGGVALYAARIRQMDRQNGFDPQKSRKKAFGRAI